MYFDARSINAARSMTDPLLTIRQVAEMTRLSRSTISRAAAAGRLASVRFGPHAVRFDPADVEAWIAAHRVIARPPVAYPMVGEPAPRRRTRPRPADPSLRLVPGKRRG